MRKRGGEAGVWEGTGVFDGQKQCEYEIEARTMDGNDREEVLTEASFRGAVTVARREAKVRKRILGCLGLSAGFFLKVIVPELPNVSGR